MSMNPYVGWGVTTLLSWWVGKGSSKGDSAASEPETLSIQETQTGTPIPVIMGRSLLKAPLVSYYGDFRADIYTEEYAAHANFSAWPMVLSLIAQVLTAPATGTTNPGQPVTTSGGGGSTSGPGTNKDRLITPLIQSLFLWLLSWLINGRNLKTTMQKGFKYYLGYQMINCWSGPAMKLRGVYLDKTKVWEGNVTREETTPVMIPINNEQLFGGPDENGGFIGDIHVYLGGDQQGVDPWMVEQMKAPSIDPVLQGLTPAYQNFVSMVVPTAYIGKQATIPETWLDLQWNPSRLGLGAIGDDCNPVEVIYELMVNQEWGICEPAESINVDSLLAIGEKLKAEKMGVTVHLKTKTAARQVVDTICDHINMVRYTDPATGKLTFKLIRDDYDPGALQILNETNCSSVHFTRLDWRETIGEICVTYTDGSAQYEESTITFNDPANVEINEGVKNSKDISYLYFTNAENALWAAKREGRQQGYPLAAVSIIGNRQLASLRNGDVIRLDWAPHGVSKMPVRITDVDLGTFEDGQIQIEGIEDVFGLDKTEFGFSGSPGGGYTPTYPTGVQHFRYLEAPWELLHANHTYVYALAAQPDYKTKLWTVWRKENGEQFESTNSMTKWTAAGSLVYNYDEFTDVEDVIGFEVANIFGLEWLQSSSLAGGVTDITSARRGSKLLIIGDEVMAWSSIAQMPNGHWRISGILRGIFDTVPATHANNDVVYFLENGSYANVTTGGPVTTAGNVVTESYNITTGTIDGQEAFDANKAQTITTVRRAERPNPPGRVRINAYEVVDEIQADQIIGDVKITFVPRNKQFSFGCVSQNDIADYFSGLPIEAPEGLDYIVRAYAGTKKINEYVISENRFDYTWAQRCKDSHLVLDHTRIEIFARLNGLESYQPQHRDFYWQAPTLIDVCVTEEEILARLAEWGLSDRVTVPAGVMADEQQVLYSQMPIFIMGTKSETLVTGTIASWDGSYMIPDGRLFLATSKTTGTLINLTEGYTVMTRYVWQASGGRSYYSWDGMKLSETVMGG
jgi:hypothetical protein